MFDEAFGAVAITANGATDQARHMILNLTGTGGTITIPNVDKAYLVKNGASGSVTFTTGSGTTYVSAAGTYAIVLSMGSNVVYGVDVQPYDADLVAIAALTSAADKLPY